ncbi:MAG: glycosyltransferase family 1 protein [Chloroflexi bacterium]|nr:MAG: glycosyltransferase family 1 protein [Chloroflexota bacterium]RLC85198.1 MAG: glycosyltransferase family 1 protein [Chloroflexota bacterium]
MHIAFLNPQGNFDPADSYWTEHPDFGGQLVYVKELALAMGELGHRVDMITRRIADPDWPQFAAPLDSYPDRPEANVRIVRIPCGPDRFLPKEELWPHLGPDWVTGILDFYRNEGALPHAFTAHYADGGLTAALIRREIGIPFTFTAHSLGAQKMDKLGVSPGNLADLDARYHFARRVAAERVSMSRAGCIVASTRQERREQYGHRVYRGAVDVSDDTRFAVIPPGVNRRIFFPTSSPADDVVRRRIEASLTRDIAAGRRSLPLIVCSSRLDRKKNHLGLVRAFVQSERLQAAANLALVVRGLDDPLRQRDQLKDEERAILDEVAALLDEHGLWDTVASFTLDSQGELAAAYRYLATRRSVFALTALYEPFGLAPLEAMSCGLPAVVTKNGGPGESMREGEQRFGVLVDPEDPDDVARGLLEVVADDDAWNRYREAGIRRVVSCYTWERTAEGYLAAIETMLGREHTADELPIPTYFTRPTGETDIPLAGLGALYFEVRGEGG